MSENTDLNIDQFADQFNDRNNSTLAPDNNEIMVIGVGGGGGNAVNHMFRQGVEKVTFVVCNTDRIALEDSPVPRKILIGDGLGAGADPKVGREFAEQDIEKINAVFSPRTSMLFVTAGMGGGTGTGAGPVVARAARERGILTVGIVTIPFVFEGRKKILKALAGAEEMSKYVDALLLINNERLAEIYPDINFFNAFGKADDTLTNAAKSIADMINIHGYMNIDFKDVRNTLKNSGTAIISTGYGEGEHRVTKAIEDALNSPLLKNRDVVGSKRLLLHLTMARDDNAALNMRELSELNKFVEAINSDVEVITGVAVNEDLGPKVKITLLAAGFDVTLRDDANDLTFKNHTISEAIGVTDEDEQPTPETIKKLEEEYGQGTVANLGSNYIILTPEQFNDDNVIEILERSPAYNRGRREVAAAQHATKNSQDTSTSAGEKNGDSAHVSDRQIDFT